MNRMFRDLQNRMLIIQEEYALYSSQVQYLIILNKKFKKICNRLITLIQMWDLFNTINKYWPK